jgi:hypothetical protein
MRRTSFSPPLGNESPPGQRGWGLSHYNNFLRVQLTHRERHRGPSLLTVSFLSKEEQTMYAKVTTSLAALIVIVPAMVMTAPASEAAEPTRARAKPTTMAKPSRAMVQRQRFNQIVHQKPTVTNQPTMQRTFGKDPSLPKPNRPLGNVKPDPNAPVTPTMTAQEQLDLAKRQGMSPKIISVLENKAAQERPNRPLGKAKLDPNAPVTPKMTAQEQLDLAKKQGMSPKIISVLENKVRKEREAAATPSPVKPGDGVNCTQVGGKFNCTKLDGTPLPDPNSTGDNRPKPNVIIVMPGRGDAPGVAEPAPRYDAPRYQVQPRPQVQPQRVVAKDDPTCVQGTWAMLGDEKKYVCLSWHFRGQLFTTDQLDQVLESLGRTRPAYNGN